MIVELGEVRLKFYENDEVIDSIFAIFESI